MIGVSTFAIAIDDVDRTPLTLRFRPPTMQTPPFTIQPVVPTAEHGRVLFQTAEHGGECLDVEKGGDRR